LATIVYWFAAVIVTNSVAVVVGVVLHSGEVAVLAKAADVVLVVRLVPEEAPEVAAHDTPYGSGALEPLARVKALAVPLPVALIV